MFPCDLDGDGDVDVLASEYWNSTVSWYENNGDGTFKAKKIIASKVGQSTSVFATDLDRDGDADVLWSSWTYNKVVWQENLGGGSFGPEQVITTKTGGAACVYATDLDGDGDPDVLSASRTDGKIAWYRNRLNTPNRDFSPQKVITTSAKWARAVYAKDLDGDGDADVISASRDDNKIAWYENQITPGGGSFGPQRVISTSISGARALHAEDLDGDGDADILASPFLSNVSGMVWFENLGGGVFGPKRIIMKVARGVWSVYAADLDGDGDADVISASSLNRRVVWCRNDGNGNFGGPIELTRRAKGAKFAYPADLDGDGDPDIVAMSMHDDRIRWFRNLLGAR
jgi:hypothetical protein